MRALRKQKGLTQKKLGAMIHVSQSYISKIEHGHINGLTVHRITKLARIFNLKPWEMLKILEKDRD